jgi:hypothetical protein
MSLAHLTLSFACYRVYRKRAGANGFSTLPWA